MVALLADSLSFLVSAICLLAMRSPDRVVPPASGERLRTQIGDGIRFLGRDPLLRPLVLFGGTANLALTGCALLIPLAAHGWRELLAALGGLGVGLGIVAGNVISSSFTQAYTPANLFARSNATINVFNYGMMPLGALLGGVLAAQFGIQAAMWATAGLLPLSATFIVFSPLRRLRTLPGTGRYPFDKTCR